MISVSIAVLRSQLLQPIASIHQTEHPTLCKVLLSIEAQTQLLLFCYLWDEDYELLELGWPILERQVYGVMRVHEIEGSYVRFVFFLRGEKQFIATVYFWQFSKVLSNRKALI